MGCFQRYYCALDSSVRCDYLLHFTEEETWHQKDDVTYPWSHCHWNSILGFVSPKPVLCHLNPFGKVMGVSLCRKYTINISLQTHKCRNTRPDWVFFLCPISSRPLAIPLPHPTLGWLWLCYLFLFRLGCPLSSLPVEILSIVYRPSQRPFFSWVLFLDSNGRFLSLTLAPPNGVMDIRLRMLSQMMPCIRIIHVRFCPCSEVSAS